MTQTVPPEPQRDLRAVPDPTDARAMTEAILFEVRRVIVGQDAMLERILVGLLSGGHILLEGVPGLAKTLTIKTLADVLGGSFKRVQFTPDLMPSDLVGTRIYRPGEATFETELGPVFANFLLADEINRAPAKVQSALLEVMQEHQVTIGLTTYPVPSPFIVLATENPIEAEGTYPLPEAQLDRFMLKILLDYPNASEEAQIVTRSLRRDLPPREIIDTEGLDRAAGTRGRGLRRPADHQLLGRARRSHSAALLLGRPGTRVVRRVRREPARLDQPRPRRPGTRGPARSAVRAAVRSRRARARRPAPPPGDELLRADRRHHAGRGHHADPRARQGSAARHGRGADRVTDLARVGSRGRTPARPGPGPVSDDLVKRLELALTRRVGGRMAGDHRGLGLGVGLELDRLRAYEPGDDVRRIDWNATARSLVPQVREDVPDRQLTAWLLLDESPSMHFGTADRRKADVAEGAALVIGRFVARRSDRLGVIAFGSGDGTGDRLSPPAGGRTAMAGLLRTLASDPPDEGGGPTSMTHALQTVAASRTTAGLVAIISDFRGPFDWRPALTSVAGRHTVLAIEIVDPREGELVDVGELTLIDPETGRKLLVDTSDRRLRQAFEAAAGAEREGVAAEFKRLGIRHLRLTTEGSWLAALARGLDSTGRFT